MEPDETENIEYVQEEYFEDRLPNEEKGWYKYYNKGLDSQTGDLLLFQYKNHIIASAIFEQVIRVPDSRIDDFLYKGAIVLKKNSIKTFKPITTIELDRLIGHKKLDLVKYSIDKANIKDLVVFIDRLDVSRK